MEVDKMKKIFPVLLILLFIFNGCAVVNKIWNPTSKTICDEPEFAEGSLICQVATEYETTPEALNNILLDGVAIGAIAEPEERAEICGFLSDLSKFYVVGMDWSTLLQYVKLSAEQSRLINSIIQRRIPMQEFYVDMVISKQDDWLLREGWQQHWDQLFCEE
jgi:hypothetical protein